MPNIQFSGYILPDYYKLTIDPLPSIKRKQPEFDLEVTYQPKIKNSIVTVDCVCNLFDPSVHLNTVYSHALDFVRVPIDLFSFANAVGFIVILDRLTDDSGKSGHFVMKDEGLAKTATSINNLDPKQFSSLVHSASQDPGFFLTLRDLIEILTESYVAPRNAFRVVEGIRHLLSPRESDKLKSWRKLQNALRIDQSYLEPIRKYSLASRHGEKTSDVTGAMCTDITFRAWKVMNRYIEYRTHGNMLPSELPLLT